MVVRGRYNYCEPVGQNQESMIQDSVNELVAKSDENKFQLNKSKCKEMGICFVEIKVDFAPIIINYKAMEVVSSVKLLGLNISEDLKWTYDVSEIFRKFSAKLCYPKQLKRASVVTKELTTFYSSCIVIPSYLSDELEGLQKRATRIISPHTCTCQEVLGLASIVNRFEFM